MSSSDDELVKVARAQNEAEADLLQGLLREEGVPSTVRRAPGADVPDFLSAGARDVMVAASRAQDARDVLLRHDAGPSPDAGASVAPLRLLAGLLVAVAVIALVVWLGTELAG